MTALIRAGPAGRRAGGAARRRGGALAGRRAGGAAFWRGCALVVAVAASGLGAPGAPGHATARRATVARRGSSGRRAAAGAQKHRLPTSLSRRPCVSLRRAGTTETGSKLITNQTNPHKKELTPRRCGVRVGSGKVLELRQDKRRVRAVNQNQASVRLRI